MQHRPTDELRASRRSSAPISWALAALVLGGCAISKQVPETVGLPEESADAGSRPKPDADSPSSQDAATSGSGGSARTAADMPMPMSSDDAGAAGAGGMAARSEAGAGAGGARAPAHDAGTPPASDAAIDASPDPTLCAFELAECLLLDPLNYEECLRQNMERCGLLAGDASVPAAPSPACSMQTAECIMRMPDKAQECLAMQEMCRL